MKKIISAMFVFLTAGLSLAGWPLGNIGLDVDSPVTLLDVGRTATFRGPIIFPSSGSSSEDILNLFGNCDMADPGIYFGINSFDGFASITLDDEADERILFSSGGTPIFRNYSAAIELREQETDKRRFIGTVYKSFRNCSGIDVLCGVGNFEECNSAFTQMDNFDDNSDDASFIGATFVFGNTQFSAPPAPYFPQNPVKTIIQTRNSGVSSTLKVAYVSSARSMLQWFTVSTTGPMYIEIEYLPPMDSDQSGKLVYINGINMNTNEKLTPVFSSGRNYTVNLDGSSGI